MIVSEDFFSQGGKGDGVLVYGLGEFGSSFFFSVDHQSIYILRARADFTGKEVPPVVV